MHGPNHIKTIKYITEFKNAILLVVRIFLDLISAGNMGRIKMSVELTCIASMRPV